MATRRHRPRRRGSRAGIRPVYVGGVLVALVVFGGWLLLSRPANGTPQITSLTAQPVSTAMMVDLTMPASVRQAEELITHTGAADRVMLVDTSGRQIFSGAAPVDPTALEEWRRATRRVLPVIFADPPELGCERSSGWSLAVVRQMAAAVGSAGSDVPKFVVLPGDAAFNPDGTGLVAGELAGITAVVSPWNNACDAVDAAPYWLALGTPASIERVSSLAPEGTLAGLVGAARLASNPVQVPVLVGSSRPACQPALLVAVGQRVPGADVFLPVVNQFAENGGGEIEVFLANASGSRASLVIPGTPVRERGEGDIEYGRRLRASESQLDDAVESFSSALSGLPSGSGEAQVALAAAAADAFVASKSRTAAPRCSYIIAEDERGSSGFVEALTSSPRAVLLIGAGTPTAANVLFVPSVSAAIAQILEQEAK